MIEPLGVPNEIGVLHRLRIGEALRCADFASEHAVEIGADAIAAAVAENPQVEACRAKAREAGFDMRVTLEAVVGFVSRNNGTAVTRITTPARLLPARAGFDLTTNDRRFLRSLRIGCEEAPKEAVDNG